MPPQKFLVVRREVLRCVADKKLQGEGAPFLARTSMLITIAISPEQLAAL
ncbi:hypothetical protein DEO72_LG5g2448 [Vigna unguiculata]|uniref:Uncharacterized protein n=1 Tax=Vigna unguiculata TaxID=3917 RepID=A0A4D6LZZ4_VIGUN|nr:hypothetical protein DEO72_LG5g2448 [Vigna unguiculata]